METSKYFKYILSLVGVVIFSILLIFAVVFSSEKKASEVNYADDKMKLVTPEENMVDKNFIKINSDVPANVAEPIIKLKPACEILSDEYYYSKCGQNGVKSGREICKYQSVPQLQELCNLSDDTFACDLMDDIRERETCYAELIYKVNNPTVDICNKIKDSKTHGTCIFNLVYYTDKYDEELCAQTPFHSIRVQCYMAASAKKFDFDIGGCKDIKDNKKRTDCIADSYFYFTTTKQMGDQICGSIKSELEREECFMLIMRGRRVQYSRMSDYINLCNKIYDKARKTDCYKLAKDNTSGFLSLDFCEQAIDSQYIAECKSKYNEYLKNLPILNSCDSERDEVKKDICFLSYVMDSRNGMPHVCAYIIDQKHVDTCYAWQVKNSYFPNVDLCEKIQDPRKKDTCYVWYVEASEIPDYSVCEKVIDAEKKELCLDKDKIYTSCDNFPEKAERDACYMMFIQTSDYADVSLCSKISDLDQRNLCEDNFNR